MSFNMSNDRCFLPFPQHCLPPVLTHPGTRVQLSMHTQTPSIGILNTETGDVEHSDSIPTVPEMWSNLGLSLPLDLCNSDALVSAELAIEEAVRDGVATIRLKHGMHTHFDQNLSLILQVHSYTVMNI